MTYYDITGADLKQVAKAAYALSVPVGMGFLHAKPGELSDEDAEALVKAGSYSSSGPLDMDYVHGRCCKFHVLGKNGKMFISARWYDHSDADLKQLLKMIGKADAPLVNEK